MSEGKGFERLYNTLKDIEEKINEMQGLSDKERYSLLNLIERAKQQTIEVENYLLDITNKLNYLVELVEKMGKRLYYIDINTSRTYRKRWDRSGGYKKGNRY